MSAGNKKCCCGKDKNQKKPPQPKCDEPDEGCQGFKNPGVLLSSRVHRVKCFAMLMSDEESFFRFCRKLHVVIGTCLYSWVLMLACLLDQVDWCKKLQLLLCYLRQNSTLEFMSDSLRCVECKLLCCMAIKYKPAALWHYLLVMILLPIVTAVEFLSLVVALLLVVKNLIVGERDVEPDEEPRQITIINMTCDCEEYCPPPKRNFCRDLVEGGGAAPETSDRRSSSRRSSSRASGGASARPSVARVSTGEPPAEPPAEAPEAEAPAETEPATEDAPAE